MISRVAKLLLGSAAVVAMACVEIASPTDKPASISLVQVPEFFVVLKDSMRDTLGNVTPATLIAFNGANDTITNFTPDFFATDSVKFVIFNTAGVMFGNTLGTAHILGQIGNLQTPPTPIYVTVAPESLVSTVSKDTLQLVVHSDSASSLSSLDLSAVLRGASPAGGGPGSPVGGGIVFYSLQSFVPSKPGSPAAFLTDGAGNLTSVDTGTESGQVSRTLVFNGRQVSDDSLLAQQKVDSVVVTAHITYKGKVISVPFTIRIKGPSFP